MPLRPPFAPITLPLLATCALAFALTTDGRLSSDCPAYITITGWPGDTAFTDEEDYVVEYGFQESGGCIPPGELELETFKFERKTTGAWTPFTSYFSVGGMQAVGPDVPLVVGQTNLTRACITWIHFQTLVETQICDTKTTEMDPTPGPRINPTPYVYDAQDLRRCAEACFAATASFTTVPYFNLGAPRAVTLAYHGDRVDLRPFIHVWVKHPGGSYNTPTEFTLRIQVNAGGGFVNRTLLNGQTTLRFNGHADTVRLGAQMSVSDLTTGVYPMNIIAQSKYADGTVRETTHATKLVVVNERNSPVARGWLLAGVQRLYVQSDSSVLITEGDGSAIYFHRPTPSAYTTPLGAFSKLTRSGQVYTRAYPDSTKVKFDSIGRMTEVRDRLGNKVTFVYDVGSVYRVKQIRDPFYSAPSDTTYRRITLSYNANGLSQITDGFARTTTVTVQATTRLLQTIADPGGGATQYGYDANQRLTSITNRNGHATTLAYDAYWRVTTVTAPAVSIRGSATLSSPVTQYVSWQRAGVHPPTDSSKIAPPKADTIQARITDPAGNVTRFTVDRWGQPLQTTNPIGQVATVRRSGNGQPVKITSPYGIVDTLNYQSNGLLTYHRHGSDGALTLTYGTSWGHPTSITYPAGYSQQFGIHASTGNVDTVKSGGVVIARYWHDAKGRVDSTKDASGHLRRFWYTNAVGQVDSAKAPNGLVTRTYRDAIGRDTAVKVGSLPVRITRFDNLNRVRETLDSAGVNADSTWILTYDSLNLVQVRNPRGYVRYSVYNALGWVTSTWNSVQGSSVRDSFYYDSAGRQTTWRNRRGQKVNLAYDAASRVTRRWVTNTQGSTVSADTTTYNDAARTVKQSNGLVTETVFLSAALRPDSSVVLMWIPDTSGSRYKLRYHWTTSGLLDSLIPTTNGAAGLWTRGFGYSGPSVLASLKFGTGTTTITRNGEYLPTSYALPSSPALTLTRTRSVLETSYAYAASDSIVNSIAGRSYTLDTLGRLAQETTNPNADSARTFVYDRLGRIDTVWHAATAGGCTVDSIAGKRCTPGTPTTTYVFDYDLLGNRQDQSGQYSLDDRITSFAGLTFTHDADGNVTMKASATDTTRYYWSAAGLLDSVRTMTAGYGFRYDARGRLARRYVNGALERTLLWHGAKLLAELRYVSANTLGLVAEYSWYPGLDVPHAVRTSTSTVRYFVKDGLGNVTGLTAGSSPVDRLRYDPWGKTVSSLGFVGDTIRPRWKGAMFEPVVGLSYMRNRWYDPAVGRFLSEDPTGLRGSGNLFTFGDSDPINGFDPFGLDSQAPECFESDSGPKGVCLPGITVEAEAPVPAPCDNPIACIVLSYVLDYIVGTPVPGVYLNGGRLSDPSFLSSMRGFAYYLGRDIHLNGASSGDRTFAENDRLGGSTRSLHLVNQGADISVDGIDDGILSALAVTYRGFREVEIDLNSPHTHVGGIQSGSQPVNLWHRPASGGAVVAGFPDVAVPRF